MPRFSHWLPFLKWPRPGFALLRGEFAASLTVAVVMVPQSVAYASLAGMPLVAGLYATFLPALFAVLFSASTRLSVGPSALTSVLVGASLVGLAEPGSAQWVALAAWLALLAGGVQLGLGAARADWVLNLVSSPVLAGFSQAAALLIIASQIPALLGIQGPLSSLLDSPQVDMAALAYGLGSLLTFVAAKRYRAAPSDRAAGGRRRGRPQPLERLFGARRRDRVPAGRPARLLLARPAGLGRRWARWWCRRWSSRW